jgi:hypothetical protein
MITAQYVLCFALLWWSVVRSGRMGPRTPLIDKCALAALGGAAAAYIVELHQYGSPHIGAPLLLLGAALWVLPPTVRCWLCSIKSFRHVLRQANVESRNDR